MDTTINLFRRITENSQPHATYSRNWSASYRSLDFAEIFVPRAPRRFGAGLLIYDGAELFTTVSPEQKERIIAPEDGSPLSITLFSYAENVLATTKKAKLVTAANETCCFVEIDVHDRIALTFRFGRQIRNALNRLLAVNGQRTDATQLESRVYRTTRQEFHAFFRGEAAYDKLEAYILETIGVPVIPVHAEHRTDAVRDYFKDRHSFTHLVL